MPLVPENAPQTEIHLRLEPARNFSCTQCGDCCRGWGVPIDPDSYRRFTEVDWKPFGPRSPSEKPCQEVENKKTGRKTHSLNTKDGACYFLEANNLCLMHRVKSFAFKDLTCRKYPFDFLETPDGVLVSTSYACEAITANHGQPFEEQRTDLEGLYRESRKHGSLARLGDSIPLSEGLSLPWPEARQVYETLELLISRQDRTLEEHLIAGNRLLFRLRDVLSAASPSDNAQPARAAREALESLQEENFERLYEGLSTEVPPVGKRRLYLIPFLQPTFLAESAGFFERIAIAVSLWRGKGELSSSSRFAPSPVDLEKREAVALEPRGPASDLIRKFLLHKLYLKLYFHSTPEFPFSILLGYQILCTFYALAAWYARAFAQTAGTDNVALQHADLAVRWTERRHGYHIGSKGITLRLPKIGNLLYRKLLSSPRYCPIILRDLVYPELAF